MKKGQHPWPTDGVTRRQLDRAVDIWQAKYDRIVRKWEALTVRLRTAEAEISALGVLVRAHIGEEEDE